MASTPHRADAKCRHCSGTHIQKKTHGNGTDDSRGANTTDAVEELCETKLLKYKKYNLLQTTKRVSPPHHNTTTNVISFVGTVVALSLTKVSTAVGFIWYVSWIYWTKVWLFYKTHLWVKSLHIFPNEPTLVRRIIKQISIYFHVKY